MAPKAASKRKSRWTTDIEHVCVLVYLFSGLNNRLAYNLVKLPLAHAVLRSTLLQHAES